ncbi:MAG: M28 family peptidase [Carboxylicivirga sp.]|jgi:hypothetical protein|nr:M28 family peptidase [Carboxylicivirga sp.]
MRAVSIILLAVLFLPTSYAQSPRFKAKYLDAIRSQSLQKHVYTLAADSMKGRDTGSEGEHKAAKYIIEQFEANGLKPFNDTSYLQNIGLWSFQWDKFEFNSPNKVIEPYKDLVYLSSSPIDETLHAQCVFIGNGSDSIIDKLKLEGKIAFALVDNFRRWYRVASKVKQKGVKAIIIAHHNDADAFSQLSDRVYTSHQSPSIRQSKPTFSDAMIKAFAADQSLTEVLFDLPVDSLKNLSKPRQFRKLPTPKLSLRCPLTIEPAEAYNVAAYLPGKKNQNEAIVITAHYDHVGVNYKGICVGADDNASGTAAVLELAKAFEPLKGKLDKNLIFLTTSGEEKGLLGAFYFANHPTEHRFNIKANVNIDMIGRIDSTHKSNYIYTIGNNHYPEFDSLLHVANNMIEPLSIQYDYNKSQGFGNFLRLSDHYAFHRIDIPVMGFFSGLHKDYHKPTDTPDKIDYSEMEQRVKLIFNTIYLAAQQSAFNSEDD